jgi:hypothetical protein
VNRRSRLFRLGLISGLGALVAAIAFLVAPSQQARAQTPCTDCWIVTPSSDNPATAKAGTGEIYSFTVTNNDPNETLQNLTFTAPADFVITDASGPSGTTLSALPGSSVTLTLPSNAASSFTVNVTALAPCIAAGSEMWGLSDMDSLDNNEAEWSSSAPSVSVTGQCGLAFTGQPAETAVNSHILTGIGSTGSALAVQLVNANNHFLDQADFSANGIPVTISIQTNPSGGTLTGHTTVNSMGGVAHFGDLQIDKVGVGYQLAAQAPQASGFMSTTSSISSFFTVTGQIQLCGTGSCSASQSTATTATSATTTAPGDFLALGLGGVSLTCDDYNSVSDTADFGIFDSSGASVASASAIATVTIPASVVKSVQRPLPLWQVCYGSQTPFRAIPRTSGTTVIGGTTYQTGLLLSCVVFGPNHAVPCVKSKQLTQAGDIILTFVALGDPVWRP